MTLKLNLGYSRLDSFEHVLYIPGHFEIDDETGAVLTGEFSEPIGGADAPFTLIMASKSTDQFSRSRDAFADAKAKWWKAKHPNSKKKAKDFDALIADEDGQAYFEMLLDFALGNVIGWKNPPVEEGQPANPPYDAQALRAAIENDHDMILQITGAYSAKNASRSVQIHKN